MATQSSFRSVITELVARHPETTLGERWADAQRIDRELTPQSFWIRDTADLVNVTWITHDAVIDITWFPTRNMSSLTFLHFSDIVGIEIRQTPSIGASVGLPVEGDLAVTITAKAQRAGLIWIADAQTSDSLRVFVAYVLDRARTV